MAIFTDVHITQGAKTYAPVIHKPFEVFAPQYQMDYSYAPTVNIESPGATGSVITTKKEAMSEPYVGGTDVTAPTTGVESDPMGMILILGLVAVGGYVAVSLLKKKKK